MHNHDDKYPTRPGFEPGTSWLQAPVDTNEPLGTPRWYKTVTSWSYTYLDDLRLSHLPHIHFNGPGPPHPDYIHLDLVYIILIQWAHNEMSWKMCSRLGGVLFSYLLNMPYTFSIIPSIYLGY